MSLDDTIRGQTVSERSAEPHRPRSLTHLWSDHVAGQLVRFAVVGVLNTGLSLIVYKLAVDVGVAYPVAAVIAFAVGALNSYTFNRVWTFRAGRFTRAGFMRYLVVQLIGLGVNELVLVTTVEGASFDRLAAQAVALVVASTVMFVLNRYWAFATT